MFKFRPFHSSPGLARVKYRYALKEFVGWTSCLIFTMIHMCWNNCRFLWIGTSFLSTYATLLFVFSHEGALSWPHDPDIQYKREVWSFYNLLIGLSFERPYLMQGQKLMYVKSMKIRGFRTDFWMDFKPKSMDFKTCGFQAKIHGFQVKICRFWPEIYRFQAKIHRFGENLQIWPLVFIPESGSKEETSFFNQNPWISAKSTSPHCNLWI